MIRRCPRCKEWYKGHPAISRKDNKTKICPGCGMLEAIEAFVEHKNKEKQESSKKVAEK